MRICATLSKGAAQLANQCVAKPPLEPSCLHPPSEAAALFWAANIHTLLEPRSKAASHCLPLNGAFVHTDACWRVRTQGGREGLGKEAQYKGTCHPKMSTDDDGKRGARWRMHPSWLLEDANGEFSVQW